MIRIIPLFLTLMLLVSGCDDGVLNFPELPPAKVRIVNTSQDVETLNIVIDQTQTVSAQRGSATQQSSVAAGRPVGFVLKDGDVELRRDTLFYTLGGNGNVILFTRGSKVNLVEFRRAINDTTLDAQSNPVIRFTHMAENVNQYATLEVWVTGGSQLFGEEYDPGLSSTNYESMNPGTYTFEIREAGTTNVAATLQNVTLEKGHSYMLYAWDAQPPLLDKVALSIF